MGTFNLSNAEYEIMEFLWAQNQVSTLQDVIAYCTNVRNHSWKQQTIYTFLARLEHKGAVTAVKQGHKRYYSAAMPMEEFKKNALHHLLEESYDGSLKNFLAAYTGGGAMDAGDIAVLHELLDN